MSDYETHFGTLRKVDLGDLTLEEKCKELCEMHRAQYSEIYGSYKNLLSDILDNFYIILNNELYAIEDTQTDNDYYCMLKDNGDGSYSYYAHFYNGGTCLKECLEDELDNI